MRCGNFKRRFAVLVMAALALGMAHLPPVHAQAVNGAGQVPLTQLQGTSDDTVEQGDDSQRPLVDGIAAVVNQNVITFRQLELETRSAQAQLQRQNIPVPDTDTLRRQVLQRMISNELERQEAERLNINVTDEHVDRALQSIAERNRISPAQLRQEVEASGISWETYLKDLRQDVQLEMLRQRTVDNTIVISDAEVDAFLRTEGRQMSLLPQQTQDQVSASAPSPAPVQPPQQSGPKMLGLAHILVAVPEGASSAQVSELRQKAEAILKQVRGGADFAGTAASSSDGPRALDGGDMGVRPHEGWPDLFLEATQGLAQGEITDVFQSGNGFHILKVTTLGSPGSPQQSQPQPPAPPQPVATPEAGYGGGMQAAPEGSMLVTQTHARHILVKTSQVMSDEQAEQRLLQLQQRLSHGEDFAALAKRYSEDSSAPQGGDLGWLTPGETVPAFEQAMNALEPGQISGPVQSQFGWHLIQVLERRSKDMEDEFKRMQARQILFQRRVEPALDDWLSQLRGQAYIENRLDPQSSSRKRR